MKTSPTFQPSRGELDDLIRDHPLGQVVSATDAGLLATPLPLLLERGQDGAAALIGHFARANPHVEALEARPEALVIFMGPQGYVSPSWFTDRTQAPTWNFATAHLSVRIAIDRSPESARDAVDRLTAAMEAGRPAAWSGADMGARYDRLVQHVVAFRAEVLSVDAKFKLGQNERPDVLAEAIAGVGRDGHHGLEAAMHRANAHRLAEAPTA